MRFGPTSFAILAGLLVIVTAVPSPGLDHSSMRRRDTANDVGNDVCESQECRDTASRITSSMNRGVNPCDDFYEYTCGNYMKDVPVTDAFGLANTDTVREQINAKLQSLFEANDEVDEIPPFKQARILFKSCMNEAANEAKGTLPLIQFTKTFGGWPVLEGASWNESNFDWAMSPAEWNRAGLSPKCFINIRMKDDRLAQSLRAIYIQRTGFLDSPAFVNGFNGTVEVRKYYQTVVDIAAMLGADRKTAETEIEAAIRFQIQVNTIIEAPIRREKTRITLKDLIERYPTVDWKTMLAKIFSPEHAIADSDVIVVDDLELIGKLIELVSKTPKRVQANFAMFQIIRRAIPMANREITKKWYDYEPQWFEESDKISKSLECLTIMKEGLPPIVAAMYTKKLSSPEITAYASDLLQKLLQEYREVLDKVPFFDDTTRMYAMEKENAIKRRIGYPEEILDDNILTNYYRDLTFSENSYLDNYLRLQKFTREKYIAKIPRRLEKINPVTIRRILKGYFPYYDHKSNTMVLPSNVFEGNFFNLQRPNYINFGTIGFSVGHELPFVCGSPGNKYDVNGTYKDWWTEATKRAYEEQSKCFIDQFGKYVLDTANHTVNGIETLEENMADLGGLKIVYRAYVNSMRGKAPEKRLPGLDRSPNQLFWIAFGNMFCQKIDVDKWYPIYGRYAIQPPQRIRVIETLSYIEDFAKDFQCPPGSKMNPIKKCSGW